MGLTFWAGCKKEDAQAFNAAESIIPFKGRQMTIGAAKAHYQKSQQELGKNYRTANDGDVDWENAVIDTAANGQVEVIAPVKGYAYSGTDGRKWAINTKFEYDENGNPQGDYAIVTHDIGNTADEWTNFSGHVLYFGMDKVFKAGYKYDNGAEQIIKLETDSTNAASGDALVVTIKDVNGCLDICFYEHSAKTSGSSPANPHARNNAPMKVLDNYCVMLCRGRGGSTSGGGSNGGSLNGGGGGGFGGGNGSWGSGSTGSSTTGSTADAALYNANLMTCRSYVQRYRFAIGDRALYTLVSNSQTQGNTYSDFSKLGMTKTLVRDAIAPGWHLSTAQSEFLCYSGPDVAAQISRCWILGSNFTAAECEVAIKVHLERYMHDSHYCNALIQQNFPDIFSTAWWHLQFPFPATYREWETQTITLDTGNPDVDAVLKDINEDFVVSKAGQRLGLSGMLRFFVKKNIVEDGTPDAAPPPFPIRVSGGVVSIPNAGAVTTKVGSAIFITLADRYFTTGETKLGLAATYIHEIIHAYLLSLTDAKKATLQGWSNCIDANSLNLHTSIFSNTSLVTLQHTAMIKNTSEFVAEWLQAYATEKGIDVPDLYIAQYGIRNGVLQSSAQIEKQFFRDMAYGQFSDISPNIIQNAMGGDATLADVTRAFEVATREVTTALCPTQPCLKTIIRIAP